MTHLNAYLWSGEYSCNPNSTLIQFSRSRPFDFHYGTFFFLNLDMSFISMLFVMKQFIAHGWPATTLLLTYGNRIPLMKTVLTIIGTLVQRSVLRLGPRADSHVPGILQGDPGICVHKQIKNICLECMNDPLLFLPLYKYGTTHTKFIVINRSYIHGNSWCNLIFTKG